MATITEMMPIVAAYEAETSIDQSIPIQRRLDALGSIIVTPENIETAKATRTALNALLKDAAAPRMRVQRAIKQHPIGKWAFTKSQLEKDIEAKADHIKLEIDAQTKSAETISLAEDVHRWCLIVEGRLTEINKLVGELAERGLHVENRGPIEDNAV